MFDIMKAVRETAAARSAVTRARRPRPELIRLRVEIERTKCAIVTYDYIKIARKTT